MTKFKENFIVLIATLVLTWSVIFFVNSTNFSTDVLWKTSNQKEYEQDVNVTFKDDAMYLISNKHIDNIASISIELMFDPSKVKLSRDDFDSNFNLSLSEKEWNNWYNIILQNINILSNKDVILKIKNITKKEFDNINIGHIQIIDNNWNIMNLTSSRE